MLGNVLLIAIGILPLILIVSSFVKENSKLKCALVFDVVLAGLFLFYILLGEMVYKGDLAKLESSLSSGGGNVSMTTDLVSYQISGYLIVSAVAIYIIITLFKMLFKKQKITPLSQLIFAVVAILGLIKLVLWQRF